MSFEERAAKGQMSFSPAGCPIAFSAQFAWVFRRQRPSRLASLYCTPTLEIPLGRGCSASALSTTSVCPAVSQICGRLDECVWTMTSQDQSRQRLRVSELSRMFGFFRSFFRAVACDRHQAGGRTDSQKKKEKKLVASGIYPSLRS